MKTSNLIHPNIVVAIATIVLLSGCAGSYSNLVSGSKLGAQEYQPAVFVEPGNEAKYAQVLAICRQVATNRQITKAQESQLSTITGVVEGGAAGLGHGAEFSNILKSAGFDTSVGEGALLGAATGIITSLASAFSRGAEDTAAATKYVLLECIEKTSRNAKGKKMWEVLE